MSYEQLLERAKKDGELFNLIHKYQHQHNPHKGLPQSELYASFEAGLIRQLCHKLLNDLTK